MIDHVGLLVSDLEASKRFYARALEPLGYALVLETHGWAGFGVDGRPDFWISSSEGTAQVHVAINAETQERVDAFHAAGIEAGGRDNGKPGRRPHYHLDYYGAFVLDPDGHNIEAVCHQPD